MSKLDDLRLGSKLTGGFAAAALMVALVGAVGWFGMAGLARNQREMYHGRFTPALEVQAAHLQLYKMRGDLYKYVTNAAERGTLASDIDGDIEAINRALAALRAHTLSAEDQGQADRFQAAWPQYQAAVRDVLNAFTAGHEEGGGGCWPRAVR